MVGHGGSSAGSYLDDPTSPISSHCASIVATSTVRVNYVFLLCSHPVAGRHCVLKEKVPWHYLTLTVLVATIDAQWEGMGDVGSARYEPALRPPCLTIRVLSYSS